MTTDKCEQLELTRLRESNSHYALEASEAHELLAKERKRTEELAREYDIYC